MRQWLVLIVVACSHPAKEPHVPPPPPPVDAAIDDQPELVTETPDAPPTAEPHWDRIGKGFDWEGIRKGVEQARIDRKGQPPDNACTTHSSGKICELSRISLAARARVVESKQSLTLLVLDVGSDDGVSEYHWAAVLDSAGKPITKYQHVEAIRSRQCAVRLAVDTYLPDARAIVIVDPPSELKAPPP